MIWLDFLFFLTCLGMEHVYAKAFSSEDDWVDMTRKIISSEMTNCSILLIFDGDINVSSLLDFSFTNVPGVTVADIKSNYEPGHLQSLKKTMLLTNPLTCQNLLVLSSESTPSKLLKEDTEFWAGHQKIFFVALPGSSALLETNFMIEPNFRFSAQMALAERSKSEVWRIYSLSIFKGAHRQKVELVNRWSKKFGFSNQDLIFPPSKLNNFEGYKFAVAALPYSPFVIPNDMAQNGPERYRGMEVDLLNTISIGANFSYYFVAPEDGQWGKELRDGSWTGMIGMVGKEEANWAISDITFSLQRLKYIDFTDTIVYDASELITPRALPLPNWQGPTRPFQADVWIFTVILVLCASLILTGLSKASVNESKRKSYFSSLAMSFLYCFQIILMRGGTGETHQTSVRLFVCVWLLCAMTINIFYTSSLTSFLILPGFTKPIENFEELVKSEIAWAKVDFGGVQNDYLQAATDPVLKDLAEGVEWRSSLDGILKEVVEGSHATWENAITTKLKVASQYTNKDGQPLVFFTGTALLLERVMWPIQKHAPYKKRLDEITSRVVESGLLEKFYSDIIFEETIRTRKKKKEESTEEEEESSLIIILTLDHFQGPFFILFLGYMFGFITLVFEWVLKRLFK